jgi:acyl transferase domain-containing protein
MVDVAIVGMACVMPGAPDLETFWANIVDGIDSVTEVPPARWDPALHYDPDFDAAEMATARHPKTVSKWGGWIPDVEFDALAWGIPPASLASIDPVQLLALQMAAGALDDAGYGDAGGRDFDRDRASVVFASGSGGATDLPASFVLRSFLPHHLQDGIPDELDAFLPKLTEDAFPGILTSVIAGRVANRLDLGGKNLTVDAACASSLAALDVACTELTAGSSDFVLCGGADLHNAVHDFFYFTAAHALSRRGRCRSFDASADGTTLGEGVGCLVLKRREDAEADGDRIYAVVRAVAGSSDGRHLGLTAPRQQGQEKALRRAYAEAALSPAEVGLVEAHGTGTVAGDRTELSTLTSVFADADAVPGSVALGTVKSNIGHIKCAAGIAALIKAAKAVYHRVQPPTLHVSQPNEAWDPTTSPFVFLDRAEPWPDRRRVAGVSAFGFGGTNYHAVLESHGDAEAHPPVGRHRWPTELFAFRAPDDAGLTARLDQLSDRLAGERGERDGRDGLVPLLERPRLRDIASSVSSTGEGPIRIAIVADDVDDLAAKVRSARAGQPTAGVYPVADRGPAATGTFEPPELPEPSEPSELIRGTDITGFLDTLAQQAVAGTQVDLDTLHAGRDSRPDRWDHPRRRAGWVVNGHLVRTADGNCLPGGARPASEAPLIPLTRDNASEVAVVMEYLRIVQGLISTGSEIIRDQLTADSPEAADAQR